MMQSNIVVPTVRGPAKQGTETQDPLYWEWVETSVWTKRMLAALGNGVKRGKCILFKTRAFHHA